MRIRRRDFSIWNEKELRSAVNFFELWMQCGMSFFRYLEVYKKIQSVGKKQKQWAKDTPEDFNYLMSLELNPDTHAFKAALETLLLINVYMEVIKKWKALQPKNRTQEAATSLVTSRFQEVNIPTDLKKVCVEAISRDLMNENGQMIPRGDHWDTFEIFITYSAPEELDQSIYSKAEASTFLNSINFDKANRKQIQNEFNRFLAEYPMTKANRFGDQTPMEFWKGKREKYVLLAPLAVAILSLPKGSDQLMSVEMTDHVLYSMFLHISASKTEPLRRLQFWFNQFRVPYFAEVEDCLVWNVCCSHSLCIFEK